PSRLVLGLLRSPAGINPLATGSALGLIKLTLAFSISAPITHPTLTRLETAGMLVACQRRE
ncbi:hypothetical protein, partial [Pseudomonas mediterranea]|uniref:hypothetical protein n=1 Tax=Pseudomonas mediterranea TaxID=183795 RepID=UPI001E4A635E